MPGDFAMVELTDNGSGMSEETLAQIFEPFFTTKDEGKGKGLAWLGLSMVFGFVKQSNGHINVDSELGGGTTFRLYFPHSGKQDWVLEEQADLVEIVPNPVPKTILAVEDKPALRHLVVKQLTQLGYNCLSAPDGPSALAILETENVDLLFTDIVMPGGLSGHDLGQIAITRWPKIKVLLTSGFPSDKLNSSSPIPNLALLTKPYWLADLSAAIRKALAY